MVTLTIKFAEILNNFFSNAVNALEILGFHGAVPLADNISHPIFRAILKYANYPSTIAINDLNNTSMFRFSNVSIVDVKKESAFSSAFILETKFSTSPVFAIIYFQILCSNTDMTKKPITRMTVIRVTE